MILCTLGCGGGGAGEAPKGLVKIKGKLVFKDDKSPVANAQISFVPEGSNTVEAEGALPAMAMTDGDGNFSMKSRQGPQSHEGVQPGTFKIVVIKSANSSLAAANADPSAFSGMGDKMMEENKNKGSLQKTLEKGKEKAGGNQKDEGVMKMGQSQAGAMGGFDSQGADELDPKYKDSKTTDLSFEVAGPNDQVVIEIDRKKA